MSSSIEIGSDDLESVELPAVRPPSVRPGGYQRPSFASFGDDEMTVVRMDKRASTSPPPRAHVEMPRIPQSPAPRFQPAVDAYDREVARYAATHRPQPPRYADDEPTVLHPSSSSRPLLSMSTPSARSVIVDDEPPPAPRSRRHVHRVHDVPPPPASRALLDDAPRSAAAVDASSSSSAQVNAVDLSMTASLSGSTDIGKLRRPSMGWAAGLVAVGVFAGLIAAVAARGDGLSAIASLVDPSHVTADVAKGAAAQPQAPVALPGAMMPGAAAPQAQPASIKPAAPSCAADAVAPVAVAAKPVAKAEPAPIKEVVVVKSQPAPVVAYVAPVRHVEAAPVHHAEPAPVHVAEHVAAAAPVSHPAAHARHHGGDEMESASAADALAKAQLDAALTR